MDVYGSYSIPVVLVLFAVLVTIYLWYRIAYMPYTVFTKMGIPGPRPKAFYGHYLEFAKNGVMFTDKLVKNHGKVCGVYRGSVPVYIVSDPDMLKQIMVKEFTNFMDRLASYEEYGFGHGIRGGRSGLLFKKVESWQQTRRLVSPSFSSGKLKMMVQLIEESCTSLAERMQAISDSGKSNNILRLYGEFTMEIILATAFGYKIELLKGKVDGGDELLQAASNVFKTGRGGSLGVTLLCLHSHFHWLTPLLRWLGSRVQIHSSFVTLRNTTMSFVQARRSNPLAKKDLLQLMIDANNEEMVTSCSSQAKKSLTDDEIVSIATGFMLGGYETTSNALSYTSYLLALNPDKQNKLCAAIDAYFEENEEASLYDAGMGIEYLDWVIQESLRIYPPGAQTVRNCEKTCTIKDVTIVKGARVQIPIYSLHHSSEYWEEPEQFIPERFHPDEKAKRHPLVYMPFGFGPRNCIGMRFALIEVKMALVTVLRKFKMERSPDTEVPLKTRFSITLGPVNGIYLNVVNR